MTFYANQSLYHQNSQSFYPSESFTLDHIIMRHPVVRWIYLLCCPLLAPQITGILWPVPSPDIVNSSWQSKPVSSIVVAPASRLNDSKSSRKLHTPENYKKLIDIVIGNFPNLPWRENIFKLCKFWSFHLNQKNERKYFCISALVSKMGQIIKIMPHYHAN